MRAPTAVKRSGFFRNSTICSNQEAPEQTRDVNCLPLCVASSGPGTSCSHTAAALTGRRVRIQTSTLFSLPFWCACPQAASQQRAWGGRGSLPRVPLLFHGYQSPTGLAAAQAAAQLCGPGLLTCPGMLPLRSAAQLLDPRATKRPADARPTGKDSARRPQVACFFERKERCSTSKRGQKAPTPTHLLEVLLGLVHARHVVKGDPGVGLHLELRLALAKG